MHKKVVTTTWILLMNLLCFAQDRVETNTLNYDPHKLKIIPDKVFEIGIPLFIIFLLLNTVVTILKNRAENQLKLKMLEKEVSEETLIQIFKESNAIAELQPLKWFLFTLAIALAFLVIHFSRHLLINQSGYLAGSVFLLFLSAAFFIYYQILQRKQ
ncbi:MAG: hypothetical protein H0U27_14275 [Nitrosopumilus sp.]|nr:hypothetical protein [Nitrosopumilus sp.]